jgi:hypothetical protein
MTTAMVYQQQLKNRSKRACASDEVLKSQLAADPAEATRMNQIRFLKMQC